jgi:drug/metabolite transporter (DMT)-like permease
MLLLAAAMWAAVTVMIKAGPLSKIRASRVLFYQLMVSAWVLPFGALLLGQADLGEISPLVLSCIAYQTIWVAFVTYLIWFWLIRNYPASRLSAFLFMTPILGVMEGAILLDEPITYRLATALVMVCIGIYVVNQTRNRAEANRKQ